MRKWYAAARVNYAVFLCAYPLTRERAHGIKRYTTCACDVSAKFNTRKMRYTANSQNIVTINNSDRYEFRRGFCTLVLSLSCVCVYLSVPALAASASVETSKQRYSRVSLIGVSKKPSVQKLWRGKANISPSWAGLILALSCYCLFLCNASNFINKKKNANEFELTVSRFRAVSGPTKHSSYVKGNWWVECCFRG